MPDQLRFGIDPLRYARSFIVLAEEQHFGRAAKRLGLSQPSLSQQIARLELSLGFLLFERTGRGINLTSAGVRYASGMREVVAITNASIAAAEHALDADRSSVKVGFVSAAMFMVLPRALKRFGVRFPSSEQRLLPRRTSRQIEELLAGSIDVACLRGPVSHPDLVARRITRERLFVALPAAHRLAQTRGVRLSSIRSETSISFPDVHAESLAEVIAEAWDRAGGEPEHTIEERDWPAILGLVSRGAGSSVVPQSVTALRVRGVVYRPVLDCPLRTELTVVHRPDASAHVKWLANELALAA